MSGYDIEKLKEFVERQFDSSAVPSLMEYIKIDNLSRTYDAEWNTNGKLIKAAQHIRGWVQGSGIKGLKCEIIKDQDYSPLIFTEIQGDFDETVFFYGHFDKQPPFNGWSEGKGATLPVIQNGKLYGRGGADDGYSTYGTILAIRALQQQKIPIPRCVMITEGDEESGSTHMLTHYLDKLKDKIGEPKVFFCLDSGTIDYDTFWLTNSLRGNLVCTLRVENMSNSVHSGDCSGVVPSCFRIARMLLARIQNPQTGEINQKFHTVIPAERYKENYILAQQKGQQLMKSFPFVEGCHPISSDPFTSVINRSWKPTLTITGQSGFADVSAGNIMQPSIEIRFSLRMPPNLKADEAVQNVKELLTTNVPYNAKAEVKGLRAAQGWNAPTYEKYLQEAIDEASELYYKKPRMGLGEGGSIPLINKLLDTWPKGQFIITGVLGPNSNAHGPNEFLHLDYTKKLICCMSHVLAAVSKNMQSKKQC